LELDVALGIPSNLVLRGSDIRPANAPIEIGDMVVTVGGAVQVRKAPGGGFRLLGEVNTIGGTYTFQGRRFEILRDGRIRFAGTEEIDPTSRSSSSTSRSTSLARGSRCRSPNAPMRWPAAISPRGWRARSATRSSSTSSRFRRAASGGSAPASPSASRWGEKFFFRIRQGFGDAQAPELILEYQIADFLRAQATAAETAGGTQRVTFRRIERAGIDLFVFFSY
jgi:hypothetical protein